MTRSDEVRESDWFSEWVRTLTVQRLENYHGDSRAEREAIAVVHGAFLPLLGRGRVDERKAIAAWKGGLGGILKTDIAPQTAFFATRFVHWMGGLTLGCCAGWQTWISTRPARVHESEVASQLTRMTIRDRLRAEQDPNNREAYSRFLKKMLYNVHNVASISRVTNDLIRGAKSPSPAQIVACDYVWHFMGAFHEGAWITIGMVRNAPPRDS